MSNVLVVGANTEMDIRSRVNLIRRVMDSVMQGPSAENPEGVHYGIIPGCKKPSLFKPGAEKLLLTFNLRGIISNKDDIVITDVGNGHREYMVYSHIKNSAGEEIATGVGVCSTMESKYRYRGGEKKGTGESVPKKYWDLKKSGDMAQAKSLIGGDGFGVGKIDGEWQICEMGEKMENPDIADCYNTVLKIAKKRSLVDGTLSATGASDIFTQDIEDLPITQSTNNTPPPAPAVAKESVVKKSSPKSDKVYTIEELLKKSNCSNITICGFILACENKYTSAKKPYTEFTLCDNPNPSEGSPTIILVIGGELDYTPGTFVFGYECEWKKDTNKALAISMSEQRR